MTDPDPQRTGTSPAPARGPSPGTVWIRTHLDAVYRYARRRIGPEDAEDVTQQAFLALFDAAERGRAPDDGGAWLFAVVRRRIADRYRRTGREPVHLPDGWEGFARAPLPEEVVERAELRELVQVALGLLPAHARALLEARYREGRSTAEIAERLDLTPKAVEMRLRRARAAFEERFLAVGRDWETADGGAP